MKTIEDYQRLLKTIGDFRRLSKTIKDYRRLPKSTKDYIRLPKTIKDYQEYPRLFGTPGITPRTLAVFPRREERQSRMGSIARARAWVVGNRNGVIEKATDCFQE